MGLNKTLIMLFISDLNPVFILKIVESSWTILQKVCEQFYDRFMNNSLKGSWTILWKVHEQFFERFMNNSLKGSWTILW